MRRNALFSLVFTSKVLCSIYIPKERKLEILDSLEKLNSSLALLNDPVKQLKSSDSLTQSFINLTLNLILTTMLGKKGLFLYIKEESIKLYSLLISSEEELNKFLVNLTEILSSVITDSVINKKQQFNFIPNFIKLIRNNSLCYFETT